MNFAVGDKVAYSVQFLRSCGMSHSEMAQARGVITALWTLGTDTRMASIQWSRGWGAEHVNVSNLALVGPNRRFCNVD